MSEQFSDGIDRKCAECEMLVYDIPISDDNGPGYLNPEFCPQCGRRLQ